MEEIAFPLLMKDMFLSVNRGIFGAEAIKL